MNLNLHLHSLVLDGVYTQPTPDAAPVFHPLPPPTADAIGQVLARVHARVQKLLRRRGRLPQEPSPSDPVAEQMPLLAGYAAASIQERVATGPRAGHPVRRLRSAAAVDGKKDLGRMDRLLADPGVDVFAPVPFANNKSVVRCAFLALDHDAYHLGEFAILRQVMQLWPKSRKP